MTQRNIATRDKYAKVTKSQWVKSILHYKGKETMAVCSIVSCQTVGSSHSTVQAASANQRCFFRLWFAWW